MVKTLEKYKGCFSLLCDLARMTLECSTLTEVLAALEVVFALPGFGVVLVKNRLMLEYDADACGGYRGSQHRMMSRWIEKC